MTAVIDPVTHEPSQDPSRTQRSPRKLVCHALAIGFTLEIGLRGGIGNAVVTMSIIAMVYVLFDSARLARLEAKIMAGLAIGPAVFLAAHTSRWLAWSNGIAVIVLLMAALIHSQRSSVLDASPAQLLRRVGSALAAGADNLRIVKSVAPRVSSDRREGVVRVARGLMVAVPVIVVLAALLASADAVFASLLTPDVDVACSC